MPSVCSLLFFTYLSECSGYRAVFPTAVAAAAATVAAAVDCSQQLTLACMTRHTDAHHGLSPATSFVETRTGVLQWEVLSVASLPPAPSGGAHLDGDSDGDGGGEGRGVFLPPARRPARLQSQASGRHQLTAPPTAPRLNRLLRL